MLTSIPDNWRLILSMIFALVFCWGIRKPIFKLAILKNFVDRPNNRSSHVGSIPNVGGLVVFLAFLFSFLLFVRFEANTELQYVLLGAVMVFLIGLYDDLLNISALKKMKGEVAGVLILMLGGGFYLTSLHGLFEIHTINPWLGIPLTFVAMIGLINAINLIDGIDGLCSGMTLMGCVFFGVWFYLCGVTEYALLCLVLSSAIVPFFLINLFGKRSKMFIGDSGALVLGYLLGAMAIKFCEMELNIEGDYAINTAPAVVFTVLAMPVLDTLRLFASRLMHKKSPFAPDKNHFHHKLLIIYSNVHRKATFTMLAFNLCFIGLAILGRNLSNKLLVGLAILLFALIYYAVDKMAKNKTRRIEEAKKSQA